MLKKMMLAILVVLVPLSDGQAQSPTGEAQSIRSATIARDINGFALGAGIDELRTRTAVTHVAGETYSASLDGIDYEFGLTPLGRVFRIQSIQPLGKFNPDAAFTNTLVQQLSEKYGMPATNQLPGGPAFWELIEPVDQPSGQTNPFRTMSFSAGLIGNRNGTALEMNMLDFRVLWADQSALNDRPRQTAQDRLRF